MNQRAYFGWSAIACCCCWVFVACDSAERKAAPPDAPARDTASSSAPPALVAPSAPPAAAVPAPGSSSTAEPPLSIAAQHILIEYRGAERAEKSIKRSKAQAQTLAEKVRSEALTGNFSDLVSRYSEDPGAKDRLGSLGKFTREKMHKNFSDAAFKLQINEISPVVETPFGFHVIKRNQ